MEFTKEQKERISRVWGEGNQPDQCTGECVVGGVTHSACIECKWTEEFGTYTD